MTLDLSADADGCKPSALHFDGADPVEPLFGDYAPKYADIRIPTFPVKNKRPLVLRYASFGIGASRKLAARANFACASMGMMCGKPSGITIADIDEPGDEALERALRIFGYTPLQVRTASGKHHLYYAWNGEGRIIRVNGMKIDVLGSGGFVVVPPSRGKGGGRYTFRKGGFDTLRNRLSLPTISPEALSFLKPRSKMSPRKKAQPQACNQPEPSGRDDGKRNKLLFDFCRSAAADAGSLDDLEALALARNAKLDPPLSNEELRRGDLRRTVESVWRYKQDNRLLTPGCEATVGLVRSLYEALRLNPLALAIYLQLRFSHDAEPGKTFAVAVAPLAKQYHVRPSRITATLDQVIGQGLLIRHHKGGSRPRDVSTYSLTAR